MPIASGLFTPLYTCFVAQYQICGQTLQSRPVALGGMLTAGRLYCEVTPCLHG